VQTLAISLLTFFQVFIGDRASAGMGDFHKEFGDMDVTCTPWSAEATGVPREHDDLDFEGWDHVPERSLSLRAPTHSSIGPPVTRVLKHQRWVPGLLRGGG
jgi:hypothetical protein